MPPMRSKEMAWLETSITTWVQPASRIFANSACNSKLSGVVRSVGMVSCPIMLAMVPISPTFAPRQVSRTCFRRSVEDVFPLVPVMPIMVICSAGRPKKLHPSSASASRSDSTRT